MRIGNPGDIDEFQIRRAGYWNKDKQNRSANVEIKGGDLHYLSMSVNGELNRQREYVQKYEKRLNVAGELDDQLGILKKLRGLQVRLRSKAFCLALPFGIGDHVFIVVQNDDGAVSFWETEIKRNLPTCINEIEQNIEEVIFQQKISDIQM